MRNQVSAPTQQRTATEAAATTTPAANSSRFPRRGAAPMPVTLEAGSWDTGRPLYLRTRRGRPPGESK